MYIQFDKSVALASSDGAVIYFYVKNIDATLKQVVTNCDKIIMSRTSMGEYGYIAYFQDIEGNKVVLHTMD